MQKRKYDEYLENSPEDSIPYDNFSCGFESNDEIQNQLKKLKLNSPLHENESPLYSPNASLKIDFPYFLKKNATSKDNNFSFKTEEINESKEELENRLIVTNYSNVNKLLGAIFLENRKLRISEANGNADKNKTKENMVLELDGELKNQVEDYYQKQNNMLNRVWIERSNNMREE